MIHLLVGMRDRAVEALARNARAAARLLDTGPTERSMRAAVARSRAPSNGHEPRVREGRGSP